MKRFLILSLFTLATLSVSAQRVGLVLSGGGAKGLYHVGILKALEENNIPIDYVSGASMGAIVGAMYAAGWSPDRMWNFFLTDSVSTWLTGKIPDQYKYYYRQFDPTPEMLEVQINTDTTMKQAVQLPTNLISPYLIDLAFMDMLAPASAAAGDNFDHLMVPFRCVASDMYSRKSIVFKNGSLPYAVRASMTIPLVFRPLVYQDTTLLYDGGVLNNFPFQVLKDEFKPDILIGGICAGNAPNPGVDNLMGQITMLMTQQTDYSLPDSVDITIVRRFPEISTLDYSKAQYIMQAGYQDAMAQMPQIKERISRRHSAQEVENRRLKFLASQNRVVFEDVVVTGLTLKQTAYVRRQLGLHLHTHFSYDYFYEKYLHMLSSGVFTGEFPQVQFNPATGFYKITLALKTKASLEFSLGGNLSSNSLNQLYIGAQYQRVGQSVSTYGLKGYMGFFYNSFQIGSRHDMYTNFPFYIDYFFNYESFAWNTSNAEPYYANTEWRYNRQINNYLSTSISIPVLSNSAFRAQLSGGVSDFDYFQGLHTSADTASQSSFSYGRLNVELEANSMNYPLYESEGLREVISANYIFGSESFTPGSLFQLKSAAKGLKRSWFQARYMREQYFKSSGWFSFGYMVDAVFSTHPSFDNKLITSITAPYFAPTPHSSTLFMSEYSSQSYLGFGVMPIFNILSDHKLYLKTYAYMFMPKELFHDGRNWMDFTAKHFDNTVNYIFGGSLIYQTPIGPASLTVVKYTTGPKNWNFVFNFGYTLFGKRRF